MPLASAVLRSLLQARQRRCWSLCVKGVWSGALCLRLPFIQGTCLDGLHNPKGNRRTAPGGSLPLLNSPIPPERRPAFLITYPRCSIERVRSTPHSSHTAVVSVWTLWPPHILYRPSFGQQRLVELLFLIPVCSRARACERRQRFL